MDQAEEMGVVNDLRFFPRPGEPGDIVAALSEPLVFDLGRRVEAAPSLVETNKNRVDDRVLGQHGVCKGKFAHAERTRRLRPKQLVVDDVVLDELELVEKAELAQRDPILLHFEEQIGEATPAVGRQQPLV